MTGYDHQNLHHLYRTCLRQSSHTGICVVLFPPRRIWHPGVVEEDTLKDSPGLDVIGNASSLLQHCAALTPSLDIAAVSKADLEEEARSCVDALLTPDISPWGGCKIYGLGVRDVSV